MKKEIPQLQRLELNKQNVMKILFDCKATPECKEIRHVSFFSKDSQRKAPEFPFDLSKIYNYSEVITYLLGQVYAFHAKKTQITPAEAIFNYKKEKWTDDTNVLFALYYLAVGCDALPRFIDGEKTAITPSLTLYYNSGLVPTYAPSDPRFKLEDAKLALKQLGVEIDELI